MLTRTAVRKLNPRQVHRRVIDFPITLESRSQLLLGRCSRQLRKICAVVNIVYSGAERMFIPKH